ncbi:MAG: Nif3-like dinuclear metal center hexameric protein, partial [Desulfovibrionaceae bacterium]|nr:Nif3-like dinuclear metal center hexameric protein [Desulfovibrionaceae bacterium]
DVKYHTALDSGICILDAGHFCLEEEMMRRFAAFLQLSLEGVEIKFIEAADPIRPYLFNCEKEL